MRGRLTAGPLRPPSKGGQVWSSSGQVLPGHVLVDARLGRESQHALGDDVAQDLRGATLDGVALRAQVAVAGLAAVEVDRLRAAHGPVVVAQAFLAHELDFQSG